VTSGVVGGDALVGFCVKKSVVVCVVREGGYSVVSESTLSTVVKGVWLAGAVLCCASPASLLALTCSPNPTSQVALCVVLFGFPLCLITVAVDVPFPVILS
jgi:hypothetical protein